MEADTQIADIVSELWTKSAAELEADLSIVNIIPPWYLASIEKSLPSDEARKYIHELMRGITEGNSRHQELVDLFMKEVPLYSRITTLDLSGPEATRSEQLDANVEATRWETAQRRWQLVRQRVCTDWRFCEKRREYSDDIKLVVSMVGFLVPLVDWPIRVTAIVVLFALHKGPQWMCNCSEVKP